MPIVPEVTPGRAAPAFDSAAGSSPNAFGAGIGQGVNAFGLAVTAYGEHLHEMRVKEDQLWAEDQLNQFTNDWAAIEQRARQEVLSQPDKYPNSQQYIERQWEAASGAFLERIQQERQLLPEMQRGLQSRINRMQSAAALEAVNLETDRVMDVTKTRVNDRVNMAVNEVISSPGLWPGRKDTVQALIESNASALGEDAPEIWQEAEKALDAAHLLGRVKEDPQATLSDLQNGDYDDIIDPDTKQKSISAAYREIEDRVNRADREEARALRQRAQRQNAAFADVLVRIANEDISQAELADLLAADVISPEDYRTAQVDLRREASEFGDENLETDLRIGILTGEVTLPDLLTHRESLSNDQMTELLSLADQSARRGGALAREDVQQSISMIRSFVGGERGPLAILDAEASAREARAIEEFTSRLAPDGSNHRALREEVIQNYRRPTAMPSIFELPASQYVDRTNQMNNNPELLRAAISDAAERIADDRAAGLLTPEQADYEVLVLNRYLEELRRLTPIEAPLAGG